jgi:hypothetical protein
VSERVRLYRAGRPSPSNLTPRDGESGLCLSFWVETELADGRALTWWMDVAPRADGWVIDGHVSYDGRDPAVDLPERRLADFRAVRAQVPALFQELLAAGERLRARPAEIAAVR